MPSILPVATLVTSSICLRRPSGKTYDRTCIQSLPYYTVMVVETSDVTTNCQLIMYVRYLKDGKNRTSFGGTVTIANGRADTIKDSIYTVPCRLPASTSEDVCLREWWCSSHGWTEEWCRGGEKLQDLVPYLLFIHCVAHRLAQAIWYVTLYCRPLPRLPKSCPFGQNWPGPSGLLFYIEIYSKTFTNILVPIHKH